MNRRNFTLSAASLACLPAGAQESKRLRVAQIGTRHSHANGKMKSVRGLPDIYEVVGLADLEPSDDASYSGLPRLPVDDLLALPGLRAVLVETALEDACSFATRALAAGKHIHLDKPGATSLDAFRTMRLEAEQRGLIVQMGYMLRHNPAFELLFRAVRSGWLGEITEVDAMMGKLADARTRSQLAALPGGGMFELGCHMVDAVLTLLGKPSAIHAFSKPTRADDVADNQLAVLEFPKAAATLRCNHADPFGGPRRRFAVTGTRGSMEIMPMESGEAVLRLDQAREGFKKGEQRLKLPVPKDRYVGEFQTLAKCIRGEMPFPWSTGHDVAVFETVLKASGL
jgi:predicted dehydrogenase